MKLNRLSSLSAYARPESHLTKQTFHGAAGELDVCAGLEYVRCSVDMCSHTVIEHTCMLMELGFLPHMDHSITLNVLQSLHCMPTPHTTLLIDQHKTVHSLSQRA